LEDKGEASFDNPFMVLSHAESMKNMEIPVVEFSREGYKIRKIFGLKSTVVK
jgi:hypothetical protein